MHEQHMAIGLVKIPVTDFARATTWYRDTIGLEENFAVEEYGWAQYATDNLPLCLYEVGKGGGDGQPGGDTGFHLVVADAAALAEALGARGAEIVDGPVTADDGGIFFVVADPDGNRIKVVQRQ